MRRILLFLIVFGLGSAVLWRFESLRRDEEESRARTALARDLGSRSGDGSRDDPGDVSEDPPGGDGVAPGDVDPGDGGAPPDEFFLLRGWFAAEWPGVDDRPSLGLEIDDMQPADPRGERYTARGIVFETSDRALEGAKRLRDTVNAETGTFEFVFEGRQPVGFSTDEPVRLSDVVLVRHRDAAIVPLTVEAPRLHGHFDRQRFESFESVEDDVVTLEGPGLDASGMELLYDALEGTVRLGRGATVDFLLEDGRIAKFRTTGDGPLELRRNADDADAFDAFVEGGARLVLVGDPPAEIDAQRIDVALRRLPEGDAVAIESIQARGAVVVTHGRDRFTGDDAHITSAGGELSKVVLKGSPAARVGVESEEGDWVDCFVSGEGPLVVDVERVGDSVDSPLRRAYFQFEGPGRIDVPDRAIGIDFEDRAVARGREETGPTETGASARPRDDRGHAEFLVVGDVVLTREKVVIRTESLVATVVGGRRDESVESLLVSSEGPTTLTDSTLADEVAHVEARGGINARFVDDVWKLDRAADVTLDAGGADPYTVTAGLVRDGDLALRTFTADRDVEYSSLWGTASATRGMVRLEQRVDLHGAPDEPARITLAPFGLRERVGGTDSPLDEARAGELAAESIALTEQYLDAEKSVAGFVETVDGRLDLAADHARLTRLRPSAAGDEPEPIAIVADGVRKAELVADVGGFEVSARRVEVDGTARAETAGAARLVDVASVFATGDVTFAMETVDGRLEIDAEEVRCTRGADGPDTFHLTAARVARLFLQDAGAEERRELSGPITAGCRELDFRGRFTGDRFEPSGSLLVALGDVWFQDEGIEKLSGRGHRLELRDGNRAILEPLPRGRVEASGNFPVREGDLVLVPYALTAARIEHEPGLLAAEGPDLRLDDPSTEVALTDDLLLSEARASHLRVTPDELRLDGGVEVRALRVPARTPFTMSLRSVTARRRASPPEGAPEPEPAEEGGGGRTRGGPRAPGIQEPQKPQEPQDLGQRRVLPFESFDLSGPLEIRDPSVGMVVTAESGAWSGATLSLQGGVDAPAILEYKGLTIEATWIRFDMDEYLVAAGRGILRSEPGLDEWSLAFASIEPRIQGDESLVVIASPHLVSGQGEMRSNWLAIWLLRDAWRAMGASVVYDAGEPPPPPPPAFASREVPGPDLLAEALLDLQSKEFAAYSRALYAEGEIEITQGGSRASRADALYLDVGQATGWLTEAELVQRVDAGSRSEVVRIRAKRLETDGSGRLVAERATLTTCDHDEPHYVVLTQHLALEPRADGRWRFGAKGNRLRFANGLQVPLPSIGNAVLDERGDFEGFENERGEVTPLSSLTIAQTARFGASIGASFGFETGKLGRWLARLFGMDTQRLRGRWDTDAKWLSDRGPLVSVKLDLRERRPRDEIGEDFRLEFFLSGIPDRGSDRGVLRVDESEREEERFFGWVRGRYPIVRGEWVDFAFAGQTDPGVQAEFFENEFLRWDERDTFIRWRKARDGAYFSAGVSKRVNSFRTEVEELPSFGAYLGQREIADLGRASLLYGGSLDLAHLRRLEGDVGRDPFSEVPGGAALGLDGRRTVRGVLDQRLDLVVPTGVAGIRATPFVAANATGWSEDRNEEDDASRFVALAGIELATSLHSQSDGFTNVIAPRVGVRTDVAFEEAGGVPTPFDSVERPIDGTVLEAGFRGLWARPDTFENLDLDMRLMRIEDRAGFEDTTELGVLGEWITRVGSDADGRVGLLHDGRYDVEESETAYSRSTVAWNPNEVFLIEGGYARARGAGGAALYEAAGVVTRWTLDPKWELELSHTWSLAGDGSLVTGASIRRFAHDFVLEIGVSRRAGEGGTSFGVSFTPLLAWTRTRIGILDRR